MYSTLFDFSKPVRVFPHHFGPSISTAPDASSAKSRNLSAMRSRYFDAMFHAPSMDIRDSIHTTSENVNVLLPKMAKFYTKLQSKRCKRSPTSLC